MVILEGLLRFRRQKTVLVLFPPDFFAMPLNSRRGATVLDLPATSYGEQSNSKNNLRLFSKLENIFVNAFIPFSGTYPVYRGKKNVFFIRSLFSSSMGTYTSVSLSLTYHLFTDIITFKKTNLPV